MLCHVTLFYIISILKLVAFCLALHGIYMLKSEGPGVLFITVLRTSKIKLHSFINLKSCFVLFNLVMILPRKQLLFLIGQSLLGHFRVFVDTTILGDRKSFCVPLTPYLYEKFLFLSFHQHFLRLNSFHILKTAYKR